MTFDLCRLRGYAEAVKPSLVPEPQAMFCSDCGERVKSRRSLLLARASCRRCARRSGSGRWLLIAMLAACAACGFLAGRHSAPTRTFHLIGTPIELRASASPRPPEELDASRPQTACGATTKSGRPCRRKVRDGGYCWQHRNKKPE